MTDKCMLVWVHLQWLLRKSLNMCHCNQSTAWGHLKEQIGKTAQDWESRLEIEEENE